MSDDTTLPATVAPAEDDAALVGFSLDDLRVDDTAENNGRWFTAFMGEGLDLDIKVRSFQSIASQKARRRIETKYARYRDTLGNYPEKIQEMIAIEQMADAIIVDWRGKDWKSQGKEIPYSQENALTVLTAFKPLRNRVATLAANLAHFRALEQEAVEKN